jgi:hypothetical protein
MRSQPEEITEPQKEIHVFNDEDTRFGFLYSLEDAQTAWSFEFTITNDQVFNDGMHELGALFSDSNEVPMLKVDTQWDKLPAFLDTSPELRNIHFEVIER